MTSALAQTPLHAWHASHGARMVDFAGWSMPVQYSSIVAEHNATRTSVGLFDVSHMGRLRFEGPGDEKFLDSLVTRRVVDMRPGQIRYALVTKDDGGILDDVLVYHLQNQAGDSYYQMVVNASNRQKIVDWIKARGIPSDVHFNDRTLQTAMIAVQGPKALEIAAPLSSVNPGKLRYYHGAESTICGAAGTISRTGYTGEDGCELIVPQSHTVEVWETLMAAAGPLGGTPAGLGCRDTLRLEAGMPLYGHELSEEIHPFQAGLAYAVDLDNHSFPGSTALVKVRDSKNYPERVGWQLEGKRVPREGYAVMVRGEQVGHVTSGTFSPTMERPIAMGYIRRDLAAPGTSVMIDIRSQQAEAQTVTLPFYRRAK